MNYYTFDKWLDEGIVIVQNNEKLNPAYNHLYIRGKCSMDRAFCSSGLYSRSFATAKAKVKALREKEIAGCEIQIAEYERVIEVKKVLLKKLSEHQLSPDGSIKQPVIKHMKYKE